MPALAAVDDPPAEVRDDLAELSAGLDALLPARDDGHLLIGTWNIRAFARLTPRWRTLPGDSPKRNLADLCAIAEIVRRFDVCAIQETRTDLTALRTLLRRLGPGWGFVVTDAGEGDAANDERLAYVFRRPHVRFGGLAGELVIDEEAFGTETTPLRRQFARSPFLVSFEAGPEDAPTGFTLVTLHVVYGASAAERTPEIATFAERLRDRAQDPDEFSRNLIALGDFNIDRWGDANAEAFVSRGLTPPGALLGLPRTIFDDPGAEHFYDQIAWFTTGDREALTLHFTGEAGIVDWTPLVLPGLSRVSVSWRISDHFPLWSRFALA